MAHTIGRTDREVMTTTAEIIEAHRRWMRAGGYADNTVRDACKLLYRADGLLPYGLPVATGDELADLLATDGWSAQTRATYRQHLCRLYAWAADGGWIDFDPSTKLRRPRVPPGVPNPPPDVQVAAALRLGWPWRLHIILAAYAGLRCCEIATIGREHITQARLRVTGKGGRTRIVPTDPYVWQTVAPLPAGPVAVRRDGRPATPAWVSVRTAEHLHRHGLPFTLHRLRDWYATKALDHCGNLRVVQELLGHASPATTAIYTKISIEQKAAAVAGLPRLAA